MVGIAPRGPAWRRLGHESGSSAISGLDAAIAPQLADRRTALLLVLRRKLFWLLLALAGMNFLFVFATVYLKAQIGAENPAFKRFVDQVLRSVTGSGETYRDFMFA